MNFLLRGVQFGAMHIWPLLVLAISAAMLPPNDLGVIAIIVSLATLFRPLIGFSIGRATIRLFGVTQALSGNDDARQILNLATRLGFWVSFVGLFAVAVSVTAASHIYSFPSGVATLTLGSIFIYFFGLTELLDGLYRAEERFRTLAFGVVGSRLLGLLFFVLLLPNWPNLDALLLFMVIAEFANVAYLLVRIWPFLHATDSPRIPLISEMAGRLLRQSVPVVLNALSIYLYARSMVMIAGLYDSSANIGSFELAIQITNLPMAVTIVCATVLSPIVARLSAAEGSGPKSIDEIVSYAASFTVWVNTIVAAYLTVVGPFVLLWWFPNLPVAALILALVAPLVAAKAYAQILSGEIAIVLGGAVTTAKITLASGILTVAAGFVLASSAGVKGAAIALLVTHLATVVCSVVILRRTLNVDVRYRGWSSAAMAVIVLLPTVACVVLTRHTPALAAVAGSVVFVLVLGLTVEISRRLRSPLFEPIQDGIRMLRRRTASDPAGVGRSASPPSADRGE